MGEMTGLTVKLLSCLVSLNNKCSSSYVLRHTSVKTVVTTTKNDFTVISRIIFIASSRSLERLSRSE